MRKFQVSSKSGIFSVLQPCYRFGEFTVDADQKVLLRNGTPIPLTPKVFDTLLILVENAGRIVEKDALMNGVWPDSFVEESNLTFNIQQLRKALGDNAREPLFIETVARRGYRFIAKLDGPLSQSNDGDDKLAEIETGDSKAPRFARPATYSHSTVIKALAAVVAVA